MTLAYFLRRWPVFVIAMIAGAIAGLTAAIIQTPRFVATMTLSTLGPEDASLNVGASAGGAGVVQALRGITGGGAGTTSDYSYFIALLTSDRTAAALYHQPVVLHRLFGDEWDPTTRHWGRHPGLSSDIKSFYSRVFFGTDYSPPNIPRVKERLLGLIKVQFDIESGSHLISARSPRCDIAVETLRDVFVTADQVLKGEKRERYQENIGSLREQLVLPENAPMRSQIADALLLQYLRRIAAGSSLPLAARVIDGPGCPTRPALPQPIPYAIGGAVAGWILVFAWLALAAPRRAHASFEPIDVTHG